MVNPTTAAETKKDVREVKMNDGRLVEFPGKRRLQKSSDEGSMTVTLDFENGETRKFKLPDDLVFKFALHGAEQKLGDEIAGIKNEDGTPADIEDLVLAIDELIGRLNGGEWTVRREGGGIAGTSVLARALVIHGQNIGKETTIDKVREWLKGRTQQQKMALRVSAKLKPIVDQLEAEKASKAAKVDTNVLFDDFEAATA